MGAGDSNVCSHHDDLKRVISTNTETLKSLLIWKEGDKQKAEQLEKSIDGVGKKIDSLFEKTEELHICMAKYYVTKEEFEKFKKEQGSKDAGMQSRIEENKDMFSNKIDMSYQNVLKLLMFVVGVASAVSGTVVSIFNIVL